MTTLQDAMRAPFVFDCRKHDLADAGETSYEYADRMIDAMSNSEFLSALSAAFEEMTK